MAEFIIKLRDLESGEKPYRFELTRAWMERALSGTEVASPPEGDSGVASVRATLTGREVLVRGAIDARVTAACARCLSPAVIDVHTPITALYTPAPAPPVAAPVTAKSAKKKGGNSDDEEADVEIGGDDLDREHYVGESLELDGLVRDQLLVEIPFNPLCRDDCPGIAPTAVAPVTTSTHDVIDPRFAPLLAIKLPNKE